MITPGPELDRLLCEAIPHGFTYEWPPLSTAVFGMELLMDAMEKLGWLCKIETSMPPGIYAGECLRRGAYGQAYYGAGDIYIAHHSTRSGAFAIAAAKALRIGEEVASGGN